MNDGIRAGTTVTEIKLNTTGATFFGVDWANKSGMGAVCARCGYVHTFLDGMLEWRDPQTR